MKLTWYERRQDKSWHARYWPLNQGAVPQPFRLAITKRDDDLPWHWEIKRNDIVVTSGDASDPESARLSATWELRQQRRSQGV